MPAEVKLGIRKVLANLILDGDWYIDPEEGIKAFEFQRESAAGPYTMLHFVMDVKRQKPSVNERAPGSGPAPAAQAAYSSVVDNLFADPVIQVTDAMAEAANLKPSLDDIQRRRERYYPDPA